MLKRIFTSLTTGDNLKMVLIVRSDLKMSKGKTAAQCSHASILCYQKSVEKNPGVLRNWCFMGQPKVTLKVDGVEQLQRISDEAKKLNIVTEIVHDAGRTQLEPGTATVLGLGPDVNEKIDKLVGHLKLL